MAITHTVFLHNLPEVYHLNHVVDDSGLRTLINQAPKVIGPDGEEYILNGLVYGIHDEEGEKDDDLLLVELEYLRPAEFDRLYHRQSW